MKKVLLRLFVVFSLVASSLLVAPFSVSAEQVSGFDYDNYYQLEYLQTDGNACLDIGGFYSTSYQYYIKIDLSYSGVIPSTYKTIFGFYSNSSDGSPWSLWVKDTAVVRDYVTNETQTFNNNGQVYRIEFYRNGEGSTTSENEYLFRANTTSQNVYNGISGLRIHYAEYKANTTIKKLYPAERKSDGVLGMYDVIEQYFYTNVDTSGSSFTGGPRINYIQYTISTDVSPSASGTVTGGGIYDANNVATLTAIPNQGYTFSRWSDGSTNNPLTIAVTSNMSYIAYFDSISPPSTTYTITTNVSPSASGTVTGGGTYNANTSVTLQAYPNNGYTFNSWSDGNNSNPRVITVTSDLTITANFNALPPTYYQINTSVSPSGSGTVTGGGNYLSGTEINLIATPSNGYVFSRWQDGNTDNPRTLTVTADNTYTAYFVDNSIINDIIVGYNVDIMQIEYYEDSGYNWIENITGTVTNRNGTGDYYDFNLYVNSVIDDATIFQYNVILNNDYIGLAHVTGSNGNNVINKYVYFNGNHFSFNIMYNSGSVVTQLTVQFESIVLNDKYQGTPESDASVGDITEQRDEFDSNASDLYDYENQFNSDLNDSLDDININFDIGNQFGSKFLASANWVKSQFDTLTSNTPFGSVLSFSLVLGIALLIIGKAIK